MGVFEEGDRVKVTGRSKGRGFQGVVKRHGFAGRPASHGHPMSRNPGSLGPGTDPSKVIKGTVSCPAAWAESARPSATFRSCGSMGSATSFS